MTLKAGEDSISIADDVRQHQTGDNFQKTPDKMIPARRVDMGTKAKQSCRNCLPTSRFVRTIWERRNLVASTEWQIICMQFFFPSYCNE